MYKPLLNSGYNMNRFLLNELATLMMTMMMKQLLGRGNVPIPVCRVLSTCSKNLVLIIVTTSSRDEQHALEY